MGNEVEKHHLLFPRRLWTPDEETKALRQEKLLIPPLDVVGHAALHRAVALTPVPNRQFANRIHSEYFPIKGDYIASIEAFSQAIEYAMGHERTSKLEASLGAVMIMSVNQQLTFIRDSLAT